MDPKIGRTHTTFYAQADPVGGGGKNGEATAAIKFNNSGYPQPEKVHVLDPKIARTHTTFYSQQLAQENPAGAIGGGGANWDVTSNIKYDNAGYDLPEKVLQMDPKIGRTHTTFYAQADENPAGPIGGGGANYGVTSKIVYNNSGYDAPEKVLQMDPKIGRTHTTFYAQADENPAGPIGGGGANYGVTSKIVYNNSGYDAPEKVLQMDPKIGRTHTTFYAQAEPEKAANPAGPIGGGGANHAFTAAITRDMKGYGEPEKVNVPDPKIGRTHTTFYAQNLAEMERKPPGLNPEGPIGGGGANYDFTKKITRDMDGYFEPEKVLVPDAKIVRNGTTFMAQAEPEKAANPAGPVGGGGANHAFTAAITRNMVGYGEPEKVNVPDPKIGRTHTTFY